MRIDYIFTSANLAEKLGRARVDRDAQGSNHQPLWLEFDS
jgi:exonuclease III